MRTLVAVLTVLAAAAPLCAEAEERLAIVPVVVALATIPPSDPVPFRHQMFLTNRVKAGDRTFARLLLGGRVMVLAREGSALSITEVPGAITIDVERGRVAVTVDRDKLHSEDLVEVRTPHALTTVSGDTLIVEVAHTASSFTVFGARVEVFQRDPGTGAALEPPTSVAGHHVVEVLTTATGLASR